MKGGVYIMAQEKNKLLIELLNEREAKNKKNIKELEETKKDRFLEMISGVCLFLLKKSLENVRKM